MGCSCRINQGSYVRIIRLSVAGSLRAASPKESRGGTFASSSDLTGLWSKVNISGRAPVRFEKAKVVGWL